MERPATFKTLPPDEIVRRIEKALVHGGGTHTWDDLREGLIRGEYQIFYNEGGALVTEVVKYPRANVLHCLVGAGDLDAVLALQPEMRRFGATHQCKFISTIGRVGWERVLPKHGWKKTHVAFTYDLEGAV